MNDDGDPGPAEHLGDTGRIFFGSHGELPKSDARVTAYAEVDAANAAIGVAMAAAPLEREIATTLLSVQNDLLDLVTDLGVSTFGDEPVITIVPGYVERLDRAIQYFEERSENLGGMVLPGGTLGAALMYQARAAVRRAELAVWRAVEAYPEVVNREAGRYLNRLSTLLFVTARGINADQGDVSWVPGSSVQAIGQGTADVADATG
ncbi:ATP:cob(I)alamin adenosyltransferase [Georgenia subflava]|uniref:Corrinoid adenosyltransferase n=1 Tax=Georgenia subflava TaxID=1622177 RepID=A0A6N7EKT1_9MICO|nr:ATP:cob(I)alamin adenosyltransferase [Georgenia subflava]MPV37633.1 cob(I)yrinic acid a c-diamide adenosyltransferase [Georgenia subflava]